MTQCIGVKPNGELCRCVAARGSDFCPAHDPARKEARHRNASKAARSKPGREIKDLKAQLESLAKDVLKKSVEPKVGAVVNQILNTRARLIEVDRKLRETEELARELEELRELVERDSGRGEARRASWGA
jgi:uncharacterized Zn finger protein (UPF0148 family)